MRLPMSDKLGSFFASFGRPTLQDVDELLRKSNLSALLQRMTASEPYLFGLLPLIEDRKNEIVRQIRMPGNKDKPERYAELSVRLDELDVLIENIEKAIEEGYKAQLQLETINDTQKETANV